jgi:hypothetical protein
MRILVLLCCILFFHHAFAGNGEKVIYVTINESGIIKVGRDTVDTEHLAKYIQERLFKSYLGTGKMYDRINFKKENEQVTDTVAAIVIKEIKEGQQRALRQICTEKYKKLFGELDKARQKKIKKQFPVLFQTGYQ